MALIWTLCAFWLGAMVGFGLFAALQMSRDSDKAARFKEIAIGLEERNGLLANKCPPHATPMNSGGLWRQNLDVASIIGAATEAPSRTLEAAAMRGAPCEQEVA